MKLIFSTHETQSKHLVSKYKIVFTMIHEFGLDNYFIFIMV